MHRVATYSLGFAKRSLYIAIAFIIATVSLTVLFTEQAYAATKTWTGAGDAATLSDEDNWIGNAAPVAGDILTFPVITGVPTVSLANDLGVALGGIVLQTGSGSGATSYTLNTLSLAPGASITATAADNVSLNITGAVNAAGALTVNGSGVSFGGTVTTGGNLSIVGTYISNKYLQFTGKIAVTGDLSVTGSSLNVYSQEITVSGSVVLEAYASATTKYVVGGSLTVGNAQASRSGSITLATGSTINGVATIERGSLTQHKDATISLGGLVVKNSATATLHGTHSFPVTFGSGKSEAYPSLTANVTGWEYNNEAQEYAQSFTTLKFTGAVTLLNYLRVSTSGNADSGVVEFSGDITYNDFTIKKSAGASGKLIIGGKEIKNDPLTSTYDGDKPSESLTIVENETAILNGKRNSASIYSGGLLKGNGTIVSDLYAYYGGTVAPGLSPGKLTILQRLVLDEGSIYQAEIQSKDAYDQIIAGEEYTGSGNVVSIDGATLSVQLLPGLKVAAGDTFTIIDNRSEQDVDGTFKDLPEGTTFAVGDGLFKISYVGGDGNDVVLTVVNVPTAPDTGFALTASNPILIAGITVITAFSLVVLARKSLTLSKRI